MRTTLKTESRGPQETRKRAGAGAAPASGWPAIAASEGKSDAMEHYPRAVAAGMQVRSVWTAPVSV